MIYKISDIKVWQKDSLTNFHKKGNLSDPNNWRGIKLLHISSKLMTSVITFPLQHILKFECTSV